MWFLPKCDNVCIMNPFNPKYVDYLEPKKEHDAYLKAVQEDIAKRLAAFHNRCMMAGIY